MSESVKRYFMKPFFYGTLGRFIFVRTKLFPVYKTKNRFRIFMRNLKGFVQYLYFLQCRLRRGRLSLTDTKSTDGNLLLFPLLLELLEFL